MQDLDKFIDSDLEESFVRPKTTYIPAFLPAFLPDFDSRETACDISINQLNTRYPNQDNLVAWLIQKGEQQKPQNYSCVHEIKKIKKSSEKLANRYSLLAIQSLIAEFIVLRDQGAKLWNNSLILKEGSPLRFAVSLAFKLWFALDGAPNVHIPDHTEILKKANSKAAGQVLFNKEKLICLVNNESGHYRPDFGAIIWFLAIIHATNAWSSCTNPLSLTCIGGAGSVYMSYTLSHEQIKAVIDKTFTQQELKSLAKENSISLIENLKETTVEDAPKIAEKKSQGTPRKALQSITNITPPPYEKAKQARFDKEPDVLGALVKLSSFGDKTPPKKSDSSSHSSAVSTSTKGSPSKLGIR